MSPHRIAPAGAIRRALRAILLAKRIYTPDRFWKGVAPAAELDSRFFLPYGILDTTGSLAKAIHDSSKIGTPSKPGRGEKFGKEGLILPAQPAEKAGRHKSVRAANSVASRKTGKRSPPLDKASPVFRVADYVRAGARGGSHNFITIRLSIRTERLNIQTRRRLWLLPCQLDCAQRAPYCSIGVIILVTIFISHLNRGLNIQCKPSIIQYKKLVIRPRRRLWLLSG